MQSCTWQLASKDHTQLDLGYLCSVSGHQYVYFAVSFPAPYEWTLDTIDPLINTSLPSSRLEQKTIGVLSGPELQITNTKVDSVVV